MSRTRLVCDTGATAAVALDVAEGAEEVLRVGPWSVRRLPGLEACLVFVNTETGIPQAEPPQEVLAELELEEEEAAAAQPGGDADKDRARGLRSSGGSRPGTGSTACGETSPRFRRIVLGNKHEVPLTMARDILAALREDATIFDAARSRFSDLPAEPTMKFSGLPEELEGVAASMSPGQLSDVIGTEAGMQILLRVC